MKKVIILVLGLIILSSCASDTNFHVPIKEGDTRTTETKDYIMTEVCTGANSFGHLFWKKVSIEKKDQENEFIE